jgi:hypothetical protein
MKSGRGPVAARSEGGWAQGSQTLMKAVAVFLFLFFRYRIPAALLVLCAALFMGYVWWAETHECVFSGVKKMRAAWIVTCAWK